MYSREVPRSIRYAEGTLRERMRVGMKGERIGDYSRATQRAAAED
jgi:hypothetical protein